jgi:hypothetical protein
MTAVRGGAHEADPRATSYLREKIREKIREKRRQ